MKWSVLVVLAGIVGLLGCRGGATARTEAIRNDSRTATLLEQAIAFERGNGVPRDYTKAAAIYQQLCDNGAGDANACRRLMHALGDARGIAGDNGQLAELATAWCLAAGDPQACLLASMMWAGFDANVGGSPHGAAIARKLEEIDAEHFEERCEVGDVRACEGYLAISSLRMSQSGDSERRDEAAKAVLCARDDLESCAGLVIEMTYCGDEADMGTCVVGKIADWTKYEDGAKLDALARLRRWCAAGDAPACGVLPGQEIAPALLCAAHDYGACAELACLGDAAAGQIAKANYGEANCYAVQNWHRARTANENARSEDR